MQVFQKDRGCVNIVDRDIEESLDLVGMDVHDQHTVNTDVFKNVGDDPGRDGDAGGTRAAVLTGVAEIRDTGGNAFGRSAFQGIDHQNDFHEVIVSGSAGGLDDKDILAANVFIDFDSGFAV